MFYNERSGFVKAMVAGSTAEGHAPRVADKKASQLAHKNKWARRNPCPLSCKRSPSAVALREVRILLKGYNNTKTRHACCVFVFYQHAKSIGCVVFLQNLLQLCIVLSQKSFQKQPTVIICSCFLR